MTTTTEPILMPMRPIVRVDEVLAAIGGSTRRALVADCYIEGVEQWTPKPWGWETVAADGRVIVNVDHHAEDARFFRNVSSGNLAMEYLAAHGADARAGAAAVVINHTDCDSVISSALLCGLIEPAERYGEAVIAADHTGEVNAIADLLQALDARRDYGLSIRNLGLLERGEAVDPEVERALEDRRRERALAARLVEAGAFERLGPVAVATLPLEERVSGEFLPSLLPGAWVIVSGTPMPGGSGGLWEIKIRLGSGAPAGTSLFQLGVMRAEPMFGGRWNAGSTKRAGGSPIAPREVALRLRESVVRNPARLQS